ncbi:MAG: T9SS type A sorting domain-containing protein [FCB group bacterium]
MKKIVLFSIILFNFFLFNLSATGIKKVSTATLNQYNLTDIISDPSGDLYLATEYGGLYRSTDEGENWFLTNTITAKYNITAILYDDFEGLFLGSKEGAFLQSTDKGVSWRIRGGFEPINCMVKTKKKHKVYGDEYGYYLTLDNKNTIMFNMLDVRAMHMSKDGTIYVCGKGIDRNDNVDDIMSLFKDVRNGLYLFSYSLASDENNRIYIGTEKGIYYSDNKGNTWQFLSQDIKNYIITNILNQKNGEMIIGTDSSGMFVSLDTGKSWQPINQPNINSRVNKVYEYKNNILFSLTSKNGLFKSTDNGSHWVNIKSQIITMADSLIVDGWTPSINFYDQYPGLGALEYLKFLNNDSLIIVKGSSKLYKIYNTITGKMQLDYQFPDSLNIVYGTFINLDSALICFHTDKYYFGLYLTKTNKLISYLTLDDVYFKNQLSSFYTILSIDIKTMKFNHKKDAIYLNYMINARDYYWNQCSFIFSELRDIQTSELIKKPDYYWIYSQDMNYYLSNYLKLYDTNDQLIYDMSLIPENKKYLQNTKINIAQISPNNKFIILAYNDPIKLLVADFKTGTILREIISTDYGLVAYGISFDDNFLFTASASGEVGIYNLNNPNDAFDTIIFWYDENTWIIALAQHSNSVIFIQTDGVLRLWKPDFTLTGVNEQNETSTNDNLVFPNPAFDYLSLSNFQTNNKIISIYSVYGIKVLEQIDDGKKIDVHSLSPGVYFLKAGDKVYKFIKL